MKKFIWVKFTFAGVHEFPEASGTHSYLKYPHRHLFHVTAEVEVSHNNREVEFLAFKDELQTFLTSGEDLVILGRKSCEDIAEELVNYVKSQYGLREIKITVSEDNENGATIQYVPTER